MQEQDIQLAARCARLAEQSRHAATWLADNRETVGSECTTLQKEMRRAARFFGFGPGKAAPFVCDSWLLHPLCAGLAEDAGIRRFAAAYRLLHVTEDPDHMDMWIIFGRPWDGDAVGLPEDTALRRLFKGYLLSGGSVGRGYGLYLRQRPLFSGRKEVRHDRY